ncbi:MAG TPA: ribosome maturation factor RimM [Acholeplasmataceae bacterium]|jgi:16S rRNA processing protein RimM|nr:ribosome maturation factor RimM [Acholeplasmataceae bacterium]
MKYVLVGKIIGTHGIKGEVKVVSDSDFKEDRFQVGNVCYLKLNEEMFPIKINSHRTHKGLDLITFNNLNNINDVLPYLQKEIFVERTSLSELDEDEYYYHELIGLDAYLESGEKIGSVTDLEEVPQGVLLILKKTDNKEVLIPFIKEFVQVDLENQRLIITPIEGLL